MLNKRKGMLKALSALLLIVILSPWGDTQRGLMAPAERAELRAICKHYVNRARFMPRDRQQEFVATLADGCESAQASVDRGQVDERLAAMQFLMRLKDLRDTIIDMNMTRVFGDTYTPWTRISYGAGAKVEDVRKVSAAGEYLIAHRMGLIDAYNSWLDTAPSMAFVSKSER